MPNFVYQSGMNVSLEIPLTLMNVVGDLRPDVRKWCQENMRYDFAFVAAEWPPARHMMYFTDDTDAALFKTFWL